MKLALGHAPTSRAKAPRRGESVRAKMLLIDIWKVPIGFCLAAIAACLSVAVTASLHATRPTKAKLPGDF